VKSLEFFKYRIISSAVRENLTFSFPICIPFTSFSCLITLARNSSTIVKVERGYLCVGPDFRGNGFSFSPFSMMTVIGLSSIASITLRCILLYSFYS
jgi:hypothetical protein